MALLAIAAACADGGAPAGPVGGAGRTGALVILTTNGAVGGIWGDFDGVPVWLVPTGKLVAGLPQAKGGNPGPPGGDGGGGDGSSADPTGTFARPVPIGVPIGNVAECSAGTLGARVKRGGSLFV